MRRGAIFAVTIALLVTQAACLPIRRNAKEPAPGPSTGGPPSSAECEWIPAPGAGPSLGTPPANPPRHGLLTLTFATNLGPVSVRVDRSAAPCTAASLEFLVRARFYDSTECHRLVPEIAALQCGDPTGEGQGGPGYRFADENLPGDREPAYVEGDVAMANTGESATNGSQFFFVYGPNRLPGYYTLFGRVTEGLDIIRKVGAAGDDGAHAQTVGGGHPKQRFTFETVLARAA